MMVIYKNEDIDELNILKKLIWVLQNYATVKKGKGGTNGKGGEKNTFPFPY